MRSYVCRTYEEGETNKIEAYAIGNYDIQIAFHRGSDDHEAETAFTIPVSMAKSLRKSLKLAIEEAKKDI